MIIPRGGLAAVALVLGTGLRATVVGGASRDHFPTSYYQKIERLAEARVMDMALAEERSVSNNMDTLYC